MSFNTRHSILVIQYLSLHTYHAILLNKKDIDLNNSDLLAVSVTSTSSNSTFTLGAISDKSSNQLSGNQLKHRFFLVIGTYQIVLVEPDATRLGWGVAIFAGFLQDLEVVSDKEDSR